MALLDQLHLNVMIGIILMPVSQIVSWQMVLHRSPLMKQINAIALFYFAWACCKRFLLGDSGEFGFLTFGLLALTTYLQKRNYSVIASVLVLLNYAYVAKFAVGESAKHIAVAAKDDTTMLGLVWAYIFKAYIMSGMCLWAKVVHELLKLPSDGYDPLE